MARKKIPTNETKSEKEARKIKDSISNYADRSEKTSWNRKMENMVKLVSKLNPIEEEIMTLQHKKQPLFDEIQEIRNVMINECIHPHEYLEVKDDYVLCKFCNRRLVSSGLEE